MKARHNQRGVALLATIMSVALMTVVVVDFTYLATSNYRSAANQINELRSEYLARSGIQVGMGLVVQDARSDARAQEQFDGLEDLWAAPFPPMPVDGGMASVRIVDETRKLNINLLVDPNNGTVNLEMAGQVLPTLFASLGVSPELIPAIIDWLDRDSITSSGGAESEYYLGLIPPYEPRNGPMPTIGDLKMIRGVNDAVFLKLRDYLTTAPETQINVNTAPPEVLMARMPEFANDPSLVKKIIAARNEQPFKSILDLNAVPGLSTLAGKLPTLFTTRSDYFTITGMGSYAGARKVIYAEVRRAGVGPMLLASWHED